MEPFRPLIAESAVITAINNRMIYPEHFVAAGRGVTMTTSGRKALFKAYEQRMDQLVTQPLFDIESVTAGFSRSKQGSWRELLRAC